MPSYLTTYSFNRNDQQFIQTLATFNSEFRILSINGAKSPEILLCKDFPKKMQSIESDQITITCQSPISIATAHIFPGIDKILLEKFTDNLRFDTMERIREMQYMVENSIRYVEWALEEEKKATNKWGLFTSDLGIAGGRAQYNNYAGIDELDQKEALLILHELTKKIDIIGAVDNQSTNQIIFQAHGVNFIISYNYPSRRPNLCKARPFALDIDKGFISLDEGDGWINPKGHDQELINELQKFFVVWKQNNYEETLFPKNTSIASQDILKNDDIDSGTTKKLIEETEKQILQDELILQSNQLTMNTHRNAGEFKTTVAVNNKSPSIRQVTDAKTDNKIIDKHAPSNHNENDSYSLYSIAKTALFFGTFTAVAFTAVHSLISEKTGP